MSNRKTMISKTSKKKIRTSKVGIKASGVGKVYAGAAAYIKPVIGVPPGYKVGPTGMIIPKSIILKPVSSSKLSEGLKRAKDEIKAIISEFASLLIEEYKIKEIEMQVSFNADGKFLGFGVGGAASVTVKISPASSE